MLDVVTSPFYHHAQGADSARANLRPDIWRSLVHTLGITKGEAEWRRLAEPASSSILCDAETEPVEDDDATVGTRETSQLTYLWDLVSLLIHDCRALPAQGSIGTLTGAFLTLVKSHADVQLYGEQRYHFAATIAASPKWGDTQAIALERPSTIQVVDRRRFWRAKLAPSSRVNLEWVHCGSQQKHVAILLNISADGLACRLDDLAASAIEPGPDGSSAHPREAVGIPAKCR
jgi:hypothetical protein